MLLRRFRNRTIALAAVVAIGMQAFWPLIAQARPGPRAAFVELCGVDGDRHRVEFPIGRGLAPQEDAAGHSGPCAFCLAGCERAAAISAAAAAAFAFGDAASGGVAAGAATAFEFRLPRFARPRAPPSRF
jgi:hypothetical protein